LEKDRKPELAPTEERIRSFLIIDKEGVMRMNYNADSQKKPVEKPHQSSLRKGRFSRKGIAYIITKCCREDFLLSSDPLLPKILINTLLFMNSNLKITLGAFVVMPDHYHFVAMLEEESDLGRVMRSIGSFSAREINLRLNRSDKVWQEGYYERAIRRSEDVQTVFDYIHHNPVRKGLVGRAEEWPYSSLNRVYYERIRWERFM
jgi:putative transposase